MKINIHNIQDVFKSKQVEQETLELKGYKLVADQLMSIGMTREGGNYEN